MEMYHHLRELFLVLVLGLVIAQTQAVALKSPGRRLYGHQHLLNNQRVVQPSNQGELHNGQGLQQTPQLHKDLGMDAVVVCDICPDTYSISPCTCVCHNTTVADIKCGPQLTSCEQLTAILNVATPVSQYLRLIVQQTALKCILANDIWGPTTFQEIILRENHFSTMDNHAFVHFNSTLKVLNLEKNELQNVCFSTLSDQPLIEQVLLSDNEIMFMPGEGNVMLNHLKEIDLHNNLLTSIQSNTFAFMPRLELLDFSHNKIHSIERNGFKFQNRLPANLKLMIKLSDNNIQNIPKEMVLGVDEVTIDLQHNYLQSLPEDHFISTLQNTNYRAKILVTGNEIVCDLGLCWIIQNETIKNCFDNFACSNTGFKLYDLSPDDIGCGETAVNDKHHLLH